MADRPGPKWAWTIWTNCSCAAVDECLAPRDLPDGPHGSRQDRPGHRAEQSAALRADQRRLCLGLPRHGYRNCQAFKGIAGALSAPVDRHHRPCNELFGGRFPHRRAGGHGRYHRAWQHPAVGGWHDALLQGFAGRAGGYAAGRRPGARRARRRSGAPWLASPARPVGGGGPGVRRAHPPQRPPAPQPSPGSLRVSGQTMTEHRQRQSAQSADAGASGRSQLPYTVANLAIAPANRQVLHERIAQRFTIMLEQGFVDEVVALRSRGDLHPGLPSIRAVGYRQVWDHLDGKLTSAEMQERGIIATRQLAKRQFTWLRSWSDLHWLDSLDSDNLSRALKYLGTVSILS